MRAALSMRGRNPPFLCAGPALSVLILLLLNGAANLFGQSVSCTTNYYPVTGDDLRAIHLSLRQSQPRRSAGGYDGLAVWNINWRFSASQNGSVCRLATFTTTTTINITLPRWVAPTNASAAVRAEWDRYIRALGQHEYGHAQYALAAAGEMQRRLKEVSEDGSCEGLKQRVNSFCQAIVQKYKQLDSAYDERTDHGRNEGARLGREHRPGLGESPRPER
jgi:predicted secreted Zn-dependent protease